MYVIDASILVADARPSETSHIEAYTFLTRLLTRNESVYVPIIALAEVAAAISRGAGDSALAQQWVNRLQKLRMYHFVAVDETLGQSAAVIAAQSKIRGCDAVYVALAERHQATLITLDRQQMKRVPAPIIARTPAEELANMGA
jgi:predicted nucleic acid-binding protein